MDENLLHLGYLQSTFAMARSPHTDLKHFQGGYIGYIWEWKSIWNVLYNIGERVGWRKILYNHST